MPGGTVGWFSDKFNYSVRPTHQLHIDFDSGPNRSESVMLQVVRYRNEWREVTGCPRASTIADAQQAASTRGQMAKRIRSLAADVAAKLKDELLRHLADGRKVDSILHFRKTSNEGLAVAKGVVEQLMQEARAHNAKK